MKIVKGEQQIIYDCKCKGIPGHRFELTWKYSGDVKGFLVCASGLNNPSLEVERLSESKELQDAVTSGSNVRVPLSGTSEHILFYYTQAALRKMNGVIKLPEEIPAPGAIHIWWVGEDGCLHLGDPDRMVVLPVTIRCQINRERRSVGLFKKEWFCDIQFSAVNIREIPAGAIYYKIGSLEYLLDVAKCPVVTLKLEDQNMPVSVGILPEYQDLYKINEECKI